MQVPVLLRTLLVVLSSLLGLLIAPRLSHAAEWSVDPSIRVAGDYDDNIHLTTQPHHSVHGLMAAPKLNLGVHSYIWQINGSAEYERRNYYGEEGLDTDNKYLNLGSTYSTERSVWQLNGSLARASVLADERVSTDKYTQGYYYYFPGSDTVKTNRIKEATNISPSWSWSVDERKRLLMSYQYTDVSYVDGSNVGLTDSSNRSATIKFTNQANPADQVFLSGSYSLFHAPEIAHALGGDIYAYIANAVNPVLISNESRSTSYQAGIDHAFSETIRGNLSLGSRRTDAEQLYRTCPSPNPVYTPSLGGNPLFYNPSLWGEPCLAPYMYRTAFSIQTNTVFSSGLEIQHENTNYSIAVSRDFNTSSAGDQVQNDTLSFGLRRTITSKLTGNISGNISEYSSETGAVTSANYRSYQIMPSLFWQWTRELSVNTTYRHTGMKRALEDKPVSSNFVSLGLMYQWSGVSFSR